MSHIATEIEAHRRASRIGTTQRHFRLDHPLCGASMWYWPRAPTVPASMYSAPIKMGRSLILTSYPLWTARRAHRPHSSDLAMPLDLSAASTCASLCGG